MTTQTLGMSTEPHDLRWFVWTIMFLLTTGVLLVTYITYTNITDETLNYTDFQLQHIKHRVASPQ